MFLSCFYTFLLHSSDPAAFKLSPSTSSNDSAANDKEPKSKRQRLETNRLTLPKEENAVLEERTTAVTPPTTFNIEDLNPYYYQKIDTLRNLEKYYKTDPTACKALANALRELGNPDEHSTQTAVEKLARIQFETLEGEESAFENIHVKNIKELLEKHQNAMNANKYQDAVKACEEIIKIAPLTGYELKGLCESAFGHTKEANEAAKEYEKISTELTDWTSKLVMDLNNEQ